MSFDDQYDAPLKGPERARLRALELAMVVDVGKADDLVDRARAFERFIIGDRATGVQDQIQRASDLACRLLMEGVTAFRDAENNPYAEATASIVVEADSMRELVKMLNGLADGVPF